MPPRLHITGDSPNADPTLLQYFIEEGFDATYLPRGAGGKPYREKLADLSSDLELGESYAIVGIRFLSFLILLYRYRPLVKDSIPTNPSRRLQHSAPQHPTASPSVLNHNRTSPLSLPTTPRQSRTQRPNFRPNSTSSAM